MFSGAKPTIFFKLPEVKKQYNPSGLPGFR